MEGLNFMNLNLEMVLRHWLYHIHQYHNKNNAKFSKNDNKKSTATIRVFTAEDNTEMITVIAAIVMIMRMMIAVAMMVTVMPSPYQYRAWESPIKESSVSTHYLAGSISDGGWQ